VAAATLAPRPEGTIDRALREVEAALGPLLLAANDPGPQEVAPPATGVVATPRRLMAEMLGAFIEGFRSIVNQKISYGCEQESQDLISEM
jgi:hypothetical protein